MSSFDLRRKVMKMFSLHTFRPFSPLSNLLYRAMINTIPYLVHILLSIHHVAEKPFVTHPLFLCHVTTRSPSHDRYFVITRQLFVRSKLLIYTHTTNDFACMFLGDFLPDYFPIVTLLQ